MVDDNNLGYIQGIPKMTFLFTKLKISDFSWKILEQGQ